MILEIFKIVIMGKSNAISTSKIKKITAIKKNWREKGIRDDLIGSNPHSKGLLFSRSILVFLEIKFTKIIIIQAIKKIVILIIIKILIIYTNLFRSFDWKSKIIFILYKFFYLPHQ